MNTNVNLEAALGVLGFLGTGFCVLLASLIILHALYTRNHRRARRVVLATAGGLALYLGLLVAFSLASSEKALALGEEKYFCEIDCHLAYSVKDVRRMKTLGVAPGEARAHGDFYVVTVQTRFDEQTISPQRGNKPLTPNSRVVRLLDESGREYEVSSAGQRALEEARAVGTHISTPLRPGESYSTTFAFDVPADVVNPRLLINEGELVTRFIVGHENSLLHKKTGFKLEPQESRGGAQSADAAAPPQTTSGTGAPQR